MSEILARRNASPSAGGYDFTRDLESKDDEARPIWTPAALPTIIILIDLPANARFIDAPIALSLLGDPIIRLGRDRIYESNGALFRVHDMGAAEPHNGRAAAIAFDKLTSVRAATVLRLLRALTGRDPGPDPAGLPAPRRSRLVLALRALDAHQQKASYRAIANGLFGLSQIPGGAWKTHDARDRTIRLVQYGCRIMQGGYWHLLRYPLRYKR